MLLLSGLLALCLTALPALVQGDGQTHNLTVSSPLSAQAGIHCSKPDGYCYSPDYNSICPTETFNGEGLARNFPNSTRPPWLVVSVFGPTVSGAQGFVAIVPEMNKVVVVFKGDYAIEQTLPADVVGWDAIGLAKECPNCTVNALAAKAYMEAKEQTGNWSAAIDSWRGQGLVFSITGHGFGGMLAQIAAADLNVLKVDYYAHALGSPAVFNKAGADWWNYSFNGEAGERGIYGNDEYVNRHDGNPNYTHAGTPFYYSSAPWNTTGGGPSWDICWLEDGLGDSDRCKPHPVEGSASNATQDHYYYWANVGSCKVEKQNTTAANLFVAAQNAPAAPLNASVLSASSATSNAAPTLTSSAFMSGNGAPPSSSKSVATSHEPASVWGIAVLAALVSIL